MSGRENGRSLKSMSRPAEHRATSLAMYAELETNVESSQHSGLIFKRVPQNHAAVPVGRKEAYSRDRRLIVVTASLGECTDDRYSTNAYAISLLLSCST